MNEQRLICLKCQAILVSGQVVFEYLGHEFRAAVPRCPCCGQIYLSGELVRGKMAEVEREMEDK